MTQITFTVHGEPKAQKRHRDSTSKTGQKIKYDPSSADKTDFKWMVIQSRPQEPFNQPIRLEVVFYFSRPKSHFGSGANSHRIKESAPLWHTSKPDADNCIKFIKDALNKIFWRDDSLICDVTIKKFYNSQPRTEVTVTTL